MVAVSSVQVNGQGLRDIFARARDQTIEPRKHLRQSPSRPKSAPPHRERLSSSTLSNSKAARLCFMLSAPPPLDLTFDNDEWAPQQRLYRTASVGSWGVTSMGRGFDWDENDDSLDKAYTHRSDDKDTPRAACIEPAVQIERHDGRRTPNIVDAAKVMRPVTNVTPGSPKLTTVALMSAAFTAEPAFYSPVPSSATSSNMTAGIPSSPVRPPFSRSPSTAHPRRRSSQQRVSLIAGRVSIAPIEPPSPPPLLAASLLRANSQSSLLSDASTRAPSPIESKESFLGERNISEFHVEGEIGRGAYGLVKRAREIQPDGSLGVRFNFMVPCPSSLPAATARHQAGHQVAHPRRLLEEASKTRHYTYRDICHVCYLQYVLCSSSA